MRTIAFVSLKGGCGKSTTCVNLAAALFQMGRRVLLVDLDGNGCITRTLANVVSCDEWVGATLLGRRPLPDLVRETSILGVHLIPSALDMNIMEAARTTPVPGRADATEGLPETALALELSRLPADGCDYAMLDSPGGHHFLINMALLACDEVIVPYGAVRLRPVRDDADPSMHRRGPGSAWERCASFSRLPADWGGEGNAIDFS